MPQHSYICTSIHYQNPGNITQLTYFIWHIDLALDIKFYMLSDLTQINLTQWSHFRGSAERDNNFSEAS
jgi:hypothetical protein